MAPQERMPGIRGIRAFFVYFSVFYRLATWRFLVMPFAMLCLALADSVGILLFFPLLERLQGGAVDASSSTVSRWVTIFLDGIGIVSVGGILAFIAATFFLKFAIALSLRIATQHIRRTLYRSIAQRLLSGWAHADYARLYLTSTTGGVANVLTNELPTLLGAFSQYAETLVLVLSVGVYSATSFFVDAHMTALASIAGFVVLILFRRLIVLTRRHSIALSAERRRYQERIVEFMEHYKYLKSTARFPRVLDRLRGSVAQVTGLQFRMGIIGDLLATIAEPIAVLLAISVLYVELVVWQRNFGLIAVFIILFYRMVTNTMKLQASWQKFFAGTGALHVVLGALRRVDDLMEPRGASRIPPFSAAITFHDVRFAYPVSEETSGDREVLHGISLTFRRNATTAIVGPSGAGKSTVVDLITGVLKPTAGVVRFDGISYDDLDLSDLRTRIGYVTQEVALFNDTIANNVAFWEAEPTVMRIGDATAQAHCDFINNLPERHAAVVGDRGIKLSVGQRQRITIARELYRDPELLLFDEATSALDSDSERAIQRSIEALRGEKTLVLIAHRLSTIRSADYIYVIDCGSVVEEGTFDVLYGDPSSAFRRMCDLQSFV